MKRDLALGWRGFAFLAATPLLVSTPFALAQFAGHEPGSAELVILGVILVYALLLLLVGLLQLPFADRKLAVFQVVVLATLLVVQSIACLFGFGRLHMRWVDRVAVRGAPIVDAIERFTDDHGRRPDELEELVPGYLPHLPETGLSESPEFEYRSSVPGSPHERDFEIFANRYSQSLDFSYYSYIPSGHYPERFSGVWELRDNGWAYFHE